MQNFGICEWSFPVDGLAAMTLAKEAGYDGIQLGEAGGRQKGYPLSNERVARLYREKAMELGLKLHSLNMGAMLAEGTLNYGVSTSRGQAARESMKMGITACRLMGIKTVVITADPKTDEAARNVIYHINYACRSAAEAGITVAMESANTVDVICRILTEADSRLRICMDTLNPLRFGTGDPVAQIEMFGSERIDHFHVKDSTADLFAPGQRGCVPLGTGDGRYKESVKKIKDIGYEGWIISENYYWLPPAADGAGDFLSLAKQDLRAMKSSFC